MRIMVSTMSKLPWTKFYPADWIKDTRALSLQARGAWIDLLMFMWDAKERGVLSMKPEAYARMLGTTKDEFETVINELETCGVTEVSRESNGKVTIASRRIQREEQQRDMGADRALKCRKKKKSIKKTSNIPEASRKSNGKVTRQKTETRRQMLESRVKKDSSILNKSLKDSSPVNDYLLTPEGKVLWREMRKMGFGKAQVDKAAQDGYTGILRAVAICIEIGQQKGVTAPGALINAILAKNPPEPIKDEFWEKAKEMVKMEEITV